MRKAIYLRFVIVIFVTAICSLLASAILTAVHEQKETSDTLVELCMAISKIYEVNSDVNYLSKIAGGDRVTIITPNGTVIADSNASANQMENHRERSEIRYATYEYVTMASRTSETLGVPLMYAAIKLENGYILRLSRQYAGLVRQFAYQLPTAFLAMFIALLIAIFLARGFAKKLTIPLEKIADHIADQNFDFSDEGDNYYEINKITCRIRELMGQIDRSRKQLFLEKDKISFILSNMDEGFILLDENDEIQLINNSAKRILNCDTDIVHQNILMLTRNKKINAGIERTKQYNSSTVFDLAFENKVYSVHISSVTGEYLPGQGRGSTILFLDVTVERSMQEQRSSFFSNASHELRTPITSVLGFSEMLEKGAFNNSQREQIYNHIYTQTRRMNNLINDILTISRLESGMADESVELVNLADIAQEVAAALMPQATATNITITLDCTDCNIRANSRRLHELISNLVENAVKYNVPNGRVEIRIESIDSEAVITVEDTGIGIPIHAQSRIFERFYRVDSGRSKQVGGTGLGLSIVKHIVLHMSGEIAIESQVDIGTKVIVKLPR